VSAKWPDVVVDEGMFATSALLDDISEVTHSSHWAAHTIVETIWEPHGVRLREGGHKFPGVKPLEIRGVWEKDTILDI
jgi:hypothetical protein